MEKRNWNKLNIILSASCGVHCMITPFLIPVMPSLNNSFELGFLVELSILLTVCVLGTFSLYHAYKKHHNVLWPFIAFVFGCLLLGLNFFFHNLHGHDHLSTMSVPVIIGTVLLVISQTMNIVYSKRVVA